MALINCPECNHQISNKALYCPNCGYPIDQSINNNSNNKKYCLIFNRIGEPNKLLVMKTIKELLNIEIYDSKMIIDNAPSIIAKDLTLENAKQMQQQLDKVSAVTSIEEQNQSFNEKEILNKHKDDLIRCPRCGSSSITTGQRGFSIITGFLGSNKTVNRCANCGYSWQPKI